MVESMPTDSGILSNGYIADADSWYFIWAQELYLSSGALLIFWMEEWHHRPCVTQLKIVDLVQHGLNYVGLLIYIYLFNKYIQYYKSISLSYDFLNNIFFSPAYFIVRIQYTI